MPQNYAHLVLECENYSNMAGSIQYHSLWVGHLYNNSMWATTPNYDNYYILGMPNARWKQLYASTTSIATSDERLKTDIDEIPDSVLDAGEKVNWCQFRFKDAVQEKGKARLHTGLIAQRIKKVFEDCNLNAFDYGLLCYDKWEAQPEQKDENGEIMQEAIPAGNRYSLRYEECLAVEAAYQRRENKRLKERLDRLEKLVSEKL